MRRFAAIVPPLALCLALSGCGDRLLQRSYSSVSPHSAAYREEADADTLRAENYQELVNALLMLLTEHSEGGVVRVYGDHPELSAMAGRACVEVQQETALGAYLLDYITYNGMTESGCYELTVRFGYRRTAEEQATVVNATSTEALPDLLRAAIEEGRGAVAIRFGYFGTDRAGVMAMVAAVHDEVCPSEEAEAPAEDESPREAPAGAETSEEAVEGAPPSEETAVEAFAEGEPPQPAGGESNGPGAPGEPGGEPAEPVYDVSPWQVLFYPENGEPGIVEVILNTDEPAGA